MNINPLVTIITPVYNREKYIEEVILSVLNQDYPNIEYIILNDGSTDNSLEIIKKYKDRITYISHDNIGETLTVNKGFNMANGDIIGIVNSDDPLHLNAVKIIVKTFQESENILVVYPDFNIINEEGKITETIKTNEYNFENMVRWHHCMPGPGAFFKREVVGLLKGRDTSFKYVSDFDFWLRAGLLGDFKRIPQALANFRSHCDSLTIKAKGIKMAKEHIDLVNKFFSFDLLPTKIFKLKKEAYSSAYYYSFITVGKKFFIKKIYYIFKAITCCPWKYFFGEYTNRLKSIKYFLFN